jgi:hypothetical protein
VADDLLINQENYTEAVSDGFKVVEIKVSGDS